MIKKVRVSKRTSVKSRSKGASKSDVALCPTCSRARLVFVFFVVFACFSLMAARMVMVGLMPSGEPEMRSAQKLQEAPVRGNIYDRNGQLLATSLQVFSLYADPKLVMNPQQTAQKLAQALPFLNRDKIERQITRKGRFVWLARQLSPTQVRAVNDLGLPGLAFRTELARVYPQQDIAAHVLGAVNRDGRGIAGIERSFNFELTQGEDIHLTIDARLQSMLVKSLQEQIDKSSAKGAAGVVIEPKTGDILALVSLPDFDPNNYGDAEEKSWRNTITHGVYEMGSTFKIFTMAQALNEDRVTLETEVDCRHPLRVGKYRIRDSHPKGIIMSAADVFKYSSNIGTAQISEMIGEEAMKRFYGQLKFFDTLDIGLMGVASPLFKDGRWGRIRTMTSSYGHGIAVTPLHLAAAVGALAGDGVYRTPHLQKLKEPAYAEEELISADSRKKLRALMRSVVQEGTGRRAKVRGFDIGGKTGTAEKAEGGGYAKNKNLATFVGVVPLEAPRFVGLMMVDEAKLENGRAAGGGHVAAPAFAAFVKRAAPLLGLVPTEPDPSRIAKGKSHEIFRIVPASYRN